MQYYGFPYHIIREVYITARRLAKRIWDLNRYRQATANMNERYPTATATELGGTDSVCIVCREEMIVSVEVTGPDLPKKLPCGHIFHFRCLRSWLERQQACPTWYAVG